MKNLLCLSDHTGHQEDGCRPVLPKSKGLFFAVRAAAKQIFK